MAGSADQPQPSPIMQQQTVKTHVGADRKIAPKLVDDLLAHAILPSSACTPVVVEDIFVNQQFDLVAAFRVDQTSIAGAELRGIELMWRGNVHGDNFLAQRAQNFEVCFGIIDPPVTQQDREPAMGEPLPALAERA